MVKTLSNLLRAGKVQRYHACEIAPQSLAAHQWGVAAIILWLYDPHMPGVALLRAALLHDVPELFTGDLPRPVKVANKVLNDELERIEQDIWGSTTFNDDKLDPLVRLTDRERDELGFADLMELVYYCVGQHRTCGNLDAASMARRVLDRMLPTPFPFTSTGSRQRGMVEWMSNTLHSQMKD